jgi:O-antigen/teichoic acid export membrane protein
MRIGAAGRGERDRAGAAATFGSRVSGLWHLPLYRSSFALILTTALNAVLGLLFWIAAARLYPQRIVGLGAGGISALQLVASIGWVGLQFTLMRYVPIAGPGRGRVIAAVYATGVVAALVVTAIFIAAFSELLDVHYLGDDATSGLAFVACVIVWVVFSLQDAVLVGIRRALLIPVENSIYGLLKLVLLVALVGIDSPWTLLGAWAGSAGALALAVNVLLFRRLLRSGSAGSSSLPGLRAVSRFSFGHTAVALTASVPDFFVPLLVLRYLDEAANAYYYAAWTIGFSARLLALNLGNALTVEGSYAVASLHRLLRSTLLLSVALLGPVVVVLLAGAGVVLQVFGSDYADAATPLLRYYAVSLVPFTLAAFVVAFDRVRERVAAAFTITAVGSALTIGLDFVLIPRMGISGAGLAWLIGQGAAAVVALVTLSRADPRSFGRRPATSDVSGSDPIPQ